jgi:hypothetical protein
MFLDSSDTMFVNLKANFAVNNYQVDQKNAYPYMPAWTCVDEQ